MNLDIHILNYLPIDERVKTRLLGKYWDKLSEEPSYAYDITTENITVPTKYREVCKVDNDYPMILHSYDAVTFHGADNLYVDTIYASMEGCSGIKFNPDRLKYVFGLNTFSSSIFGDGYDFFDYPNLVALINHQTEGFYFTPSLKVLEIDYDIPDSLPSLELLICKHMHGCANPKNVRYTIFTDIDNDDKIYLYSYGKFVIEGEKYSLHHFYMDNMCHIDIYIDDKWIDRVVI